MEHGKVFIMENEFLTHSLNVFYRNTHDKTYNKNQSKNIAGTIIKSVNLSALSEAAQKLVSSKHSRKDISRNSACPCGSGKRFKRCCMYKE